jgi:hypothetical protein
VYGERLYIFIIYVCAIVKPRRCHSNAVCPSRNVMPKHKLRLITTKRRSLSCDNGFGENSERSRGGGGIAVDCKREWENVDYERVLGEGMTGLVP